MILQTDPILNKQRMEFAESGCALLSITNIAVMKKRYNFSHDSFIEDCRKMLLEGLTDFECTILDWNGMLDALGLGDYEIVIENGTHMLNRYCKDNEFQIIRLHNLDSGFKHFVVADRFDNVTYDALGESKTVEAYRNGRAVIDSRRIFRKKGA